ncbi:AraC family transcriptional regulator [Paenibacillus baekrokdamisoli]|uniref:AraC family transcriptional regulator n=1 Tax=Paenibacillus baekrokdamisoli TaxID=1712516 RepID=A0A3G9J6M6_9BACL|nr:response regulator [Paenibacillus baekrokdamisoli]MBB3067385.1 two-component system response regulator YesN [Paenibacillus baekrokdamisoli]BBH19428.1 AraC family transcriptional regulator [Paenibacillus baekrokdamisoli]
MNKLLIVEDEAIIRKGLVNSIQWENWGFQVCGEAVNGKAALDYILHHDVDVMMTDVRMPVMDGLELSRLVKASKPEVKIVVLTGFSDFEYARQSLEHGVFQYILKPLKRDKLAEVFLQLREILDKEQQEYREKSELLKEVAESRVVVLQKQLSDWVHGRYANPLAPALMNETKPWDTMKTGYYLCALVDIDNLDCLESDFVSLFKQNAWSIMKDIASQIFNQAGDDYAVLSAVDDLGRLTLLLHIGENDSNAAAEAENGGKVADALRILLDWLQNTWSGASFSAGIGGWVRAVECVPETYQQASEALEHRFYRGTASINSYHDIPKLRTLTPQEFQQIKHAEKKLINYISTGSGDVHLIYEEMFAGILQHQRVQSQTIKNAVAQTLYSVCGYLSEQSYDKELDVMDNISMTGLTDLQHVLSYAKQKLNEIKNEIDKADPNTERNLVRQAKEFVTENYRNDFSLTEIAAQLYVNPSYFSWLFKQETGLTFTAYLTQYRMSVAKNLLKQDKQKVYEVAQCVGYNDYRHFCKMFKKVEGISPKDFKQRGK